MTKAQTFLWVLTVLIFPSCDCYISVEGIVLTSSDKLPIEGARVEMTGRNKTTKTDKNGYFHIWQQTGFCFEPDIKITANNYKPFEITFKHSSETKSYELKSKSDFVKYEKPFYPDTSKKGSYILGTWIEKFSEKFSCSGDTILFYLDTINPEKEIEELQARMRKSN